MRILTQYLSSEYGRNKIMLEVDALYIRHPDIFGKGQWYM